MVKDKKEQIFIWIVIFSVVSITTLPYLLAAGAGGDEYVFGGFLLNPIDGHSYLAKMYQGWMGNWAFTLPYTAQEGDGSLLFIFYITIVIYTKKIMPIPWSKYNIYAMSSGKNQLMEKQAVLS